MGAGSGREYWIIIEDQAFSLSSDMAPPPPPSPPPRHKALPRYTGRLRKRDNLLAGERGGRGVGESQIRARKPGTLQIVQYSLGAGVP
jgi:hypothetical protein